MNLGNPEEFTVLELARLVLELRGDRSRVVFRPLPEDDPKKRRPVIDLAKRTLGFAPRVPLRDGLVKTVAYFEGLARGKSAAERSAPKLIARRGGAPRANGNVAR
jgi:UDP-glucuronate decarboxylase